MGHLDQGIESGVTPGDDVAVMLHVYPLDPHRRRSPGILDVVRRYGEELAVTARNARTPASQTQAGAGLLQIDRHSAERDAR